MSKITRKAKIWIALLFVCVLAAIPATWIARGYYDEFFMMEGIVHVVNATTESHAVRLDFPSGKRLEFKIAGRGWARAGIVDTGEGGVGITVDGEDRGQHGYVTSRNSIMVFTIGEDTAVMSQIFSSDGKYARD